MAMKHLYIRNLCGGHGQVVPIIIGHTGVDGTLVAVMEVMDTTEVVVAVILIIGMVVALGVGLVVVPMLAWAAVVAAVVEAVVAAGTVKKYITIRNAIYSL
jgi:hypothetical protein